MQNGSATSKMPGTTKRIRPPRIDLTRAIEKKGPAIHVDRDGITDDTPDFEDTLQLSDSDSSDSESIRGTGPTLKIPTMLGNDPLPDDITKDLAELQQLRQNVKKNLRLRPIRSRGNLPKVDMDTDIDMALESAISRSPFGSSKGDVNPPLSAALSPTSSIASSYFTPVSETPQSALFSAPVETTPLSSPLPPIAHSASSIGPQSLYDRLLSPKRPLLIDTRPLMIHQSFHLRHSINIAIPSLILKRCRRPGGGLQSLDALRQFATTERGKAQWDSVMGPGGVWDGDVVIYDDEMNPKDKDNLGITAWAIIPVIHPLLSSGTIVYLEGGISSAGHHPQLQTLVVTGDEEETPPSSAAVSDGTPGAFQPVNGRKGSMGLFQLDTLSALRSKKLPELEPNSSTASNPPSPLPLAPRSPLPMMPATTSSSSRTVSSADSALLHVNDASPSPPPSSIGFRRPAPPRRPSVPNLRRLDTKSAERLNNLPKLSLRTSSRPTRSATLGVPPPTLSLSIQPPQSPSHLQLIYSNHSPTSARFNGNNPLSPSNDPTNYLTPYYTPPHTPGTPKPGGGHVPTSFNFNVPPSPITARPDLDPPTTEDAFPTFTISTILPNFLFLGPELTLQEHVDELKALGVRRILNIAAECDDDAGLRLKEVFEKYTKIPMRDTVEEDNITRGVREVCEILDDARLHSAPTYVHCKAGKSRSVTAVMAYLIHANHWTLSKAYSFVLERRKGISPNIGFVSELMNFEEQELGGKSIGVQPTSAASSLPSAGSTAGANGAPGETGGAPGLNSNGHAQGYGASEQSYALSMAGGGHLRRTHVRESLPPALGMDGIGLGSLGNGPGPMSAGGLLERVMGDSGQEMEVKDANGRYRHARRAPVDENTLQPMRRVSKAGLESSSYA